jgi:hypothetical protein
VSFQLRRRPWWRRSLATLTWMPLSVRQRPRWARALWVATTPLWRSPLRRFGPARRARQQLADWLSGTTYRRERGR